MATEIDELVVRIKADTKQLNKALDDVKKKTKDAGQSGKKGLSPATGALVGMRLAANAAAGAIIALKAAMLGVGVVVAGIALLVGKKIADVGMAFEDLRVSLNTVFGGINQGQKAFDQIISFSKTTPFQIEDVTKAFIRLKSAGLEPNIDMLTTFGDAASIAGDATEAFAALVKIAAKSTGGGLGLEELEQLETQGIAVYPILRKELDLTRDNIAAFGKSTAGAALILKSLIKGLKETTGGTMAELMANLSNKTSNLTIAFKELSLAIFESGFAAQLKTMTDSIAGFIDKIAFLIRIRNKLTAGDDFTITENITQVNKTVGSDLSSGSRSADKNVSQLFTNFNQAINLVPTLDMGALEGAQESLKLALSDSEADFAEAVAKFNNLADDAPGLRVANFEAEVTDLATVITAQRSLNQTIEDRISLLKKADELALPGEIASARKEGAALIALPDLIKLARQVEEATFPFLELEEAVVQVGLASLITEKALKKVNGEFVEFDKAVFTPTQITDMLAFLGKKRAELKAEIDEGIRDAFDADNADIIRAVASVTDPMIEMEATLARMKARLAEGDSIAMLALFGTDDPEVVQGIIAAVAADMKEAGKSAEDLGNTLGAQLKDAVVSTAHAFTNEFVNSLIEGQNALESFKNFAKSMVSQIIAIFMQMAIVNEIINNVFGLTGANRLSTASVPNPTATNASGGHFEGGRAMLVGERGPELIIPNSGGTVMNNMNSKNAMGGGQTIIVNQSLNFSTGVVGTVRAEIQRMLPTIAEVSKASVLDASRRGGNYRKGLFGA